jgi:multisubunit Na+/H+ antiporter MnhF subunit
MKELLNIILLVSLVIHIGMIAVCVWRVWRGENAIDRLLAADVIGTIVLAIFVIIAISTNNQRFIDLAIGLAALAFIGTLALARYIANRQMF